MIQGVEGSTHRPTHRAERRAKRIAQEDGADSRAEQTRPRIVPRRSGGAMSAAPTRDRLAAPRPMPSTAIAIRKSASDWVETATKRTAAASADHEAGHDDGALGRAGP